MRHSDFTKVIMKNIRRRNEYSKVLRGNKLNLECYAQGKTWVKKVNSCVFLFCFVFCQLHNVDRVSQLCILNEIHKEIDFKCKLCKTRKNEKQRKW